jgi:hypothetical protein
MVMGSLVTLLPVSRYPLIRSSLLFSASRSMAASRASLHRVSLLGYTRWPISLTWALVSTN